MSASPPNRPQPAEPPVVSELRALCPQDDNYATAFVERLLAAASAARASDIHLQPTPTGLALRWRIDGVLQPLGEFARGERTDPTARLKVLARLLTYRTDAPQEGRLPAADGRELRVCTFPALHGERVVVRFFAAGDALQYLPDLGLPLEVEQGLTAELAGSSGAILLCGPAGSGKTTTAYAALRTLLAQSSGARSLVTLEDPIEAVLPGVSQSQVNPAAGFDLASGLRSLMRQDPEVILLGEIRDSPTAAAVFQAALSGQLTLSTFHAGGACEAVGRLGDMGLEPYLLRSGLRAVIAQRLVRALCQCSEPATSPADHGGLPVTAARRPAACPRCSLSGYWGRLVLAELLPSLAGPLGAAVLARRDTRRLQSRALALGMVPLWRRGLAAIEAGRTSPAELHRVFGGEQQPG